MSEGSIRTRNLFNPADEHPFKLSRSKIELFINCPRCFYLDRRLGVERPDSLPYTLNNAVDILWKKEFDAYRSSRTPHPLMEQYDVQAIPFSHPDLEAWRDVRRGIQYLHEPTHFLVFGAIDDVWIDDKKQLVIVDYKATSTDNAITLDGHHRMSYKRQLEVYQWLFRKNGFQVSPVSYLVFSNAQKLRDRFNDRLEFETTIHPYRGDDSWIDDALSEARICLERPSPPLANADCEWCVYRKAATSVEQ